MPKQNILKLQKSKAVESADALEVEQLKADLHRIVGKSHVNCAKLREALGFANFAQWVAIECHIRCYLNELNQIEGISKC